MNHKPLVLIIEDDQSLATMYSEKFKIEGFSVAVARDGKKGFELAESMNPDIILLDMMLPEQSGNDFLEEYRKTEAGRDKIVIALTNLAQKPEFERAKKLGVKEYLVKAMHTPENVVQKVKMYLNKVS